MSASIITYRNWASEGSSMMKVKFSISAMSHRSRISVPSHEVTMRCPSKNRPLQCSTSFNISGCGICLQKMEKLCVHNTWRISGLAEDLFDCQSWRCHGSVFEKYFLLQYDAASLGIRVSASSSKRRKPLFHWRLAISGRTKSSATGFSRKTLYHVAGWYLIATLFRKVP